jgi:hypothetical protein
MLGILSVTSQTEPDDRFTGNAKENENLMRDLGHDNHSGPEVLLGEVWDRGTQLADEVLEARFLANQWT